jgi:hypothetical protein
LYIIEGKKKKNTGNFFICTENMNLEIPFENLELIRPTSDKKKN